MKSIADKIESWLLNPIVNFLIKYTSKCTECGHFEHHHAVNVDEYYCTHGAYRNDKGWLCYPCSCGYHTGR